MDIKIRKLSGNKFTKEDLLEVVLDSGNAPLSYVNHTVVVTSGPDVTHGGGAPAGEYLHYKSAERDADAEGNIDYSNTVMRVEQSTQGLSTIKVVTKIMSVENTNALEAAIDALTNEPNDGGIGEDVDMADYETLVESSEITIEWDEDTFI